MNIPKQYLPLMPYLIISNAKGFIAFMKTVFGATEQLMVPRDEHIIQHGELRIGDAVIMVADATDQFKEKPAGMFIYVESVDTVYAAAISSGAASLMPPQKQEYGFTAGFQDAWNNQWWIAQP